VATELGLEPATDEDGSSDLRLFATADRIELRCGSGRTVERVCVDFVRGSLAYRRRRGGGRRQLIARAVGLGRGPVRVLDATAGLCRDAFILAALGCEVVAVERSPLLAALVRDGIERASRSRDAELDRVLERMRLVVGDANEVMAQLGTSDGPDVIYLDPMFPQDARDSAKIKKEMRLCRMIAGDDEGAAELLERARRAARRRVVVKRPRHAPPLAPDPSPQFRSRTTRFDVYLTQASV
jgi:16S rRNA (guanine1516-N2)-methyltransferase